MPREGFFGYWLMKKTVLLLFVLTSLLASAQKPDLSLFKNMKPRSIGPAGMSGRVTSVEGVINNEDMIVIGTASGGVWKTENAGTTWTPLFDEQPIMNIGAIAIQQSNPSVLWAGTGEGNPRNSINLGGGMYKTIDGGKTWKLMGLEKTINIHRIIIDPNNPNTVYAGAIGNPFDEHPERGVYKTTDGGDTWNKILYTNDTSGVADLVMDPSNPNKLFAAMWQHRRTPFSFNSGGKGSGLYMTLDAGKTWKKLGKDDGLPAGDLGRIGLAISRSDPQVVYAMVEATKNGMYRSSDGGFRWELVNSDPTYVTTRSFYFQDIAVDPKNENRLYSLYQPIAMSEDGGRSFRVIASTQRIHADHHAIWIHPEDPSFILEGGDGGLSISRDRGKTWRFDEQLPLGQFYHINVDNEIPYNVLGGLQDNGSWRGPAYTWISGGIKNSYWDDLSGGDGFDVVPDPEDANWVYSMSQEGGVQRGNVATGERYGIKPISPDLNTEIRFNWNAAIAIDPLDPKAVYFGSQFLHKSSNKGLTWEVISPDLSTNNKEQQNQENNGGLSIDITGAENYNTILAIAPSYKQKGVIWVTTDDGNVQLTKDGGKTWTNFRGKIPGLPVGIWIPQIRASRYNAAEAFIVANDYRRGDFKPYIFRTRDFGATWQKMLDENDVKGYALCVLQDPSEPNLIFAGTEQGLWVSFDNGSSWQQWKNGYPSVSTYDLAIQEREADLAIATFGRSIYILDDVRPLRKLAVNKGVLFTKSLTAFESPTGYQSRFRQAPGYNSNSWGFYEGENRPRGGGSFSFYVKPAVKADSAAMARTNPPVPAQSDTARRGGGNFGGGRGFGRGGAGGPAQDSATVRIYNDKNELIRTLRVRADSGLNRASWGFEMKGIRQPSSGRAGGGFGGGGGGGGGRFGGFGGRGGTEPAGYPVYPGTYKLVISMGRESDSTHITVMSDPKVPITRESYDARMALLKQLDKSTLKLVTVGDLLADADETIKKVDAAWAGQTGRTSDSIRRATKVVTDSVKNIRDFIWGKVQDKQGYGTVDHVTPSSKLREANSAILNRNKIPDAQEQKQVSDAELLIGVTVARVNAFFSGAWVKYRALVETAPVKMFKDVKAIE